MINEIAISEVPLYMQHGMVGDSSNSRTTTLPCYQLLGGFAGTPQAKATLKFRLGLHVWLVSVATLIAVHVCKWL